MRYSVNAAAAQWRVVDGEAVVVNVESSYYYGLNRTGTLVWTLLAERPHTAAEIAARLAAEYAIDPAQAGVDTEAVIRHLLDEGLVHGE